MYGRAKSRVVVLAIAVGILASAAYAFTASNTVPATQAGSGSGSISGYTASSIVYTLNATTPTNIDSVAFTISPTTTTTVKAQFAAAGTWYSCSNSSGSVTCATTSPQLTVAGATNLTVVAAQ
jgi:hypothetical protein